MWQINLTAETGGKVGKVKVLQPHGYIIIEEIRRVRSYSKLGILLWLRPPQGFNESHVHRKFYVLVIITWMRNVLCLQSWTKVFGQICTNGASLLTPNTQLRTNATTLVQSLPHPSYNVDTVTPAISPEFQHCIAWGEVEQHRVFKRIAV